MDDRADESKPSTTAQVQQLKDAGIPMRKKSGGGILHWKMMLFHGQNVVEFSKANYYDQAFVATAPDNWDDEAVFFTRDNRLTNTFRTKFDNLWIDTTNYANYANITSPLVRRYPSSHWIRRSISHRDKTSRTARWRGITPSQRPSTCWCSAPLTDGTRMR